MGRIDFNAMQRETESKEVKSGFESALGNEYDKIWGKKKVGESVENIDITLLTEFKGKHGRKQPFKMNKLKVNELAESIQTIGLTTPLIVRKKDDKYQILSGHHRYQACKKLDMKEIPCIVREVSDKEAERYVIECNIQRLKLLPSEYGKILERYLDIKETLDLTVDEVAKKFGVSKKMLYLYVYIYQLEEPLQDEVDMGRIYIDLASDLKELNKEQQIKLYQLIENNPKTLVVNTGRKVIEMLKSYNLDEITDEMYAECLVPEKKEGYKNKVYNSVYKKYDIPAGKQIDEKEIDHLVSDFLDDYFSKMYEKAKVNTEEQTEDLER